MWSDMDGHFDLEERSPFNATRVLWADQRLVDYKNRINSKFVVSASAARSNLVPLISATISRRMAF